MEQLKERLPFFKESYRTLRQAPVTYFASTSFLERSFEPNLSKGDNNVNTFLKSLVNITKENQWNFILLRVIIHILSPKILYFVMLFHKTFLKLSSGFLYQFSISPDVLRILGKLGIIIHLFVISITGINFLVKKHFIHKICQNKT